MSQFIPSFDQAKVLVVGDVMLDRYWVGDTDRVSPEAPVPVIKINHIENRLGGAANVACGLAALGVQVVLLGLVGDDAQAEIVADLLKTKKVDAKLCRVKNHSTITKVRAVSRAQQLLRMDFETGFTDLDSAELKKTYQEISAEVDVIVLSDYLKGTLFDPQFFIQTAKAKNKKVIVDPKARDFWVYRGADCLTPNQGEFERSVSTFANEAELESLARQFIAQNNLGAVLVTRGSEGMSWISRTESQHLTAHAFEVKDVTGAGDTVIATIAASLAVGASMQEALILANMAAGVVVLKTGTATVSLAELERAMNTNMSSCFGVLTESQAIQMAAECKRTGKKLVMTNGCFDILHPGHIGYLEEAKKCGDRLLVAINDDASIRKLKGPKRPAKPLADRMRVLSALKAVDWVMAFGEETPERLIKLISPDVLVKGTDYKDISQVVGHEHVLASGGEVRLLGPKKEWSTTDIIAKIT